MGFYGSVDAKLFVYQDLGSRYPLIPKLSHNRKKEKICAKCFYSIKLFTDPMPTSELYCISRLCFIWSKRLMKNA